MEDISMLRIMTGEGKGTKYKTIPFSDWKENVNSFTGRKEKEELKVAA